MDITTVETLRLYKNFNITRNLVPEIIYINTLLSCRVINLLWWAPVKYKGCRVFFVQGTIPIKITKVYTAQPVCATRQTC